MLILHDIRSKNVEVTWGGTPGGYRKASKGNQSGRTGLLDPHPMSSRIKPSLDKANMDLK